MSAPPASLGPAVCAWLERSLVHGPGDVMGQPFRLDGFQRDFIGELYKLDARGRRVVRRALLGVGKGNAKTELWDDHRRGYAFRPPGAATAPVQDS